MKIEDILKGFYSLSAQQHSCLKPKWEWNGISLTRATGRLSFPIGEANKSF